MGKLWDIVQNIAKAKLKLGCNNSKTHIEISMVTLKNVIQDYVKLER